MVFHSKLLIAAILAAVASGAVLRGEPAKQASKPVAAPVKAAVADTKAKAAATPKAAPVAAVAVAKKATPQDDAKTLEALGQGLKTIHNLRAMFAKDHAKDGSEKFANGAMSEELSNKDSQVWSTIETMMGATQDAMKSIKGKSKAERETVMKSLEAKLDSHAKVLGNVTEDVGKKQIQMDEEYLLGLLLLHQSDWNMEEQLNATKQFMHNSPVAQKLFAHHDSSKPLAPQLAAMMDVKNKAGVEKVEKNTAEMRAAAAKVVAEAKKNAPILARLKKEEEKEKAAKAAAAAAKVDHKAVKATSTVAEKASQKTKSVGKAASAAARAMFIQLASTIMIKDCPYCVAQCVDKCHTAGKPYVTCLTDCADAGK